MKAIATAPGQPTQYVALTTAEQTAKDSEDATWISETDIRLAAQYRNIISSNLSATDYTQLADSALTTTEVADCKTYRQSLRDLPLDAGWPSTAVWPTLPTVISTKVQDKPV